MVFSVITVCFNAGDKLKSTIENTLSQKFDDFEIIVKDGLSTDNSLENIPKDERIKLYSQKDSGIYDAMNQAVALASGDFVIFMNCGDEFYDENVLKNTADFIKANPDKKIYYGDTLFCSFNQVVAQPKEMTESHCYRHMPNHQSCFFDRHLWDEKGFDLKYKIRGDYDFFLRCFFEENIRPAHIGITVAAYEGGGYSEVQEKKSEEEHREIVVKYMGEKKANHYRRMMILTLAPLRSKLVKSKAFSGIYSSIKKAVYK